MLKESPGIEEYATLEKILEILRANEKERKYDVIVFDTPPTGLTVRIIALPSITLLWINKLMELRLAILDRRRMITRITGEPVKVRIGDKVITLPYDPKEDPIFCELEAYRKDIEWVHSLIVNKDYSSIVMVVNPETLSVLEAWKAKQTLSRYNIHVKAVVVNKVLPRDAIGKGYEERLRIQEQALEMLKKHFSNIDIRMIPLLPSKPRGLEGIKKVAKYLE